MTTYPITLNLPEHIYRRLEQKADASDQELDTIIIQSLRAGLPPSLDHVPEQYLSDLATLDRMDDDELQSILRFELDLEKIEVYESLLVKNQNEGLERQEQETLTDLRKEADLIMLRKSYAAALLRWRGIPVPFIEN